MASSQVELASSSFGCALRRDHNPRNRCTAASFRIADENSHDPHRHIDYTDLWVHQPQWQTTTTTTVTSPPHNNIVINNNGSNKNNDKNNDHNDRWKITSHDEDKWARAREMVFVVDRNSHGRIFRKENSPTETKTSVEISNLTGVSSLVQKWRDFEAEAKCLQSNSPLCSTRSNSSATFVENALCIDVPSRDFDVCDVRPATNKDTFGDWEYDRMALSGPPSSTGRDPNTKESEKRRVVDIIRKLTSPAEDNNDREYTVGCEASTPVRTSLNQSEQSCFSPALSSPRIRGRQAFNNLLMQMETERRKELEELVARKVVSKFSQRGRIQALLRVRFLRHGVEGREGQHVTSTLFEFNKFMPSAIRHIRERFKSDGPNSALDSKNSHREIVDNVASAENMLSQLGKQNQHQDTVGSIISHKEADHILDAETSSTCQETNGSIISHKVIADHILNAETSSRSKQDKVELVCNGVNKNIEQSSLQAHGSKHLHQETSALLDTMWQGTSCEAKKHGLAESKETAEPLSNVNKNGHAEEEEVTSNQQLTKTNHDFINHCTHPEILCKNKHLTGIDPHWVSDISHPEVGWEELHSDYQQEAGTNIDWISDISRPRSDWEGLRQARYCEMLDPFLNNEEIRMLLERRSVSTFLSSGFREHIDQLMISRTQLRQLNTRNNHMEERVEQQLIQEDKEGNGEEDKVALQEDDDKQDEIRSYIDYYDGYEDESEFGQKSNVADDCIDQPASPAPSSWFHSQGHEVSDDLYQAASPSMQPSISSNTYFQDNQPLSSFTNHHTSEMDLIYDLRGQMEQLRQEMSELQKSIKSCIKIQSKLQRFIKQETTAALSHSDQKERRNLTNKGLYKGRCSICCEMPVDSLLYRCGHMCFCFKCAHELQWSSGKCPICGAQILDVVQTLDLKYE